MSDWQNEERRRLHGFSAQDQSLVTNQPQKELSFIDRLSESSPLIDGVHFPQRGFGS